LSKSRKTTYSFELRRRVVGGTEAGFGAFPWQAMVKVGATRCGGALIGKQHIVTAGLNSILISLFYRIKTSTFV